VLSKELNPTSDYKIFNGDSETICTSNGLDELMPMLFEKKITSVIIEGGTQVLQSFIDAGLWDEARVFSGVINFKVGVARPTFDAIAADQIQIESDVLKYYFND
jgi:diaminohydroxyphosphoribosylaminopyrimidine deaminase/5-amino-6-(5-phosphoribosylamino)uracil reductase